MSPADAAPAPVVLACGATITQDTVLAADMGPCPEDAVLIDASNLTFDLNGHEIVGAGGQVVPHQSASVFIINETGVGCTTAPCEVLPPHPSAAGHG